MPSIMAEESSHSYDSFGTPNHSLSVAKVSDKQISEFKTPLPPPRKKKKVLDEETYVHKLGKIIERDFFPDLENLKDKVEFLEARENNDIERLQSLHRKYSLCRGSGGRLPTPASVADSPATFDTPEPNTRNRRKRVAASPADKPSADDGEDGSKTTNALEQDVGIHLSLDDFLARHTSEDDDSFQQIMEEAKHKFMLRKAWMFNAEADHNAKFAPELTMKALPSNEHEARAIEKADQAKPHSVENWKFKTFNSIMYVPDEHHPSRAREVALAGAMQRKVVHDNTRFTANPFVKALNQATVMEASAVQAIKKEGRIGVDGRELSKETPRIRGYSFVGDASPAPGVEESPLLTWGEVEGTPFMLDKGSTPLVHSSSAPSYFMPKVPYRDLIALQLDEKANQAQRDKKLKAVSAAQSNLCSPALAGSKSSSNERWASERLANMSPAARRLLSTGLGVRQNTDRTLRASYTSSPASFSPSTSMRTKRRGSASYLTPSPSTILTRNAKGGKYSSRTSGVGLTPKSARQTRSSGVSVAAAPSLTDGLLQLPKRDDLPPKSASAKMSSNRKCAADFFE